VGAQPPTLAASHAPAEPPAAPGADGGRVDARAENDNDINQAKAEAAAVAKSKTSAAPGGRRLGTISMPLATLNVRMLARRNAQ
jgi:hypothetical protein